MLVTDPVCQMSIDSAKAAATERRQGRAYYFCSETCHRRFLDNPSAYGSAAGTSQVSAPATCHMAPASRRGRTAILAFASGIGLLGGAALLGFYFGLLTLVSGWEFARQQFQGYWPFIVALAVGF